MRGRFVCGGAPRRGICRFVLRERGACDIWAALSGV
jgi:hypothetical protein